NKMDGTFSIPFSVGDDLGVNYAESAIADFDGDGNLDYIVSTNENPARFYHYTMGCCGTFLGYLDDDPKAAYYLSRDRPLLAPDYGLGLIAADLDNDGDMDFLENINYDFGGGKLWIAKGNAHLNDGSGNFTKVSDAFDFHMISTGWTLGMSSTIVDINGDGYPDMLASEQSRGVAVSSKVYLLKGLGNGKFELVDANEDGVFDKTDDYVFQTDHHPATHITLGDFNNDGKVDALVGQDDDGDPGAAFLFLGHGDGTFDQTGIEAFDVCKDIESGTDQPCAGKFQAYDADSDGILDILSAYKLKEIYDPDENSRFVFLKGKGDGTFDDDNPLPVRLAGCDSSIGEPCIIHMTGFQVPVTFPVHLKIHGDFTGDRCIDRDDLEMILNHIRRVRHPLLRDANFDLNDDGDVNIADVRYLVTRFTNYRGAPCP
ncbi:MAG: hypothetical protein GY737_10605, partial [Desulfobacteraceae bacterium]|nr:hypothetical protein [Desulfobacteraceae bacterium]